MSRSVSVPSSVTTTSPCWKGFMVPGSTLRYGSSFCIVTCRPRAVSNWPRLDAVRPLPSEETTPPVTKRCLVAVCGCLRNAGKSNLRDDGQGIAELAGACRPTEPHPNTDADNPSLTRPAVGPRVQRDYCGSVT